MTNSTAPSHYARPTKRPADRANAAGEPHRSRRSDEPLLDRLRRIADAYERDSVHGTGLLAILSFCSAAGVTPTAFALEAVNNTGLVAQLRRSASTSPATRSRIAACMRRHVALASSSSPRKDVRSA